MGITAGQEEFDTRVWVMVLLRVLFTNTCGGSIEVSSVSLHWVFLEGNVKYISLYFIIFHPSAFPALELVKCKFQPTLSVNADVINRY